MTGRPGIRVRFAALRFCPNTFSVFVCGAFDFRVGEVYLAEDGLWAAELRVAPHVKAVSKAGLGSRSAAATWLVVQSRVAAVPERQEAA